MRLAILERNWTNAANALPRSMRFTGCDAMQVAGAAHFVSPNTLLTKLAHIRCNRVAQLRADQGFSKFCQCSRGGGGRVGSGGGEGSMREQWAEVGSGAAQEVA
jgi:hypothetical protein